LNIYKPYAKVTPSDDLLQLELKHNDEIESNIMARVLPLLVFLVLFVIYVLKDPSLTTWTLATMVFLVISGTLLLNSKKSDEIHFKKDAIEIVSCRIYGKTQNVFSLQEIDFIDLEIYQEPRICGAFYRLVLKNGKRILLLRVTGEGNHKEDARYEALNSKIEVLTGIAVNHYWKGIEGLA